MPVNPLVPAPPPPVEVPAKTEMAKVEEPVKKETAKKTAPVNMIGATSPAPRAMATSPFSCPLGAGGAGGVKLGGGGAARATTVPVSAAAFISVSTWRINGSLAGGGVNPEPGDSGVDGGPGSGVDGGPGSGVSPELDGGGVNPGLDGGGV